MPEAILDAAAMHGSTQKNGVRGGEPLRGLTYHAARPWWQFVDVKELWANRELLWMLGLRDLQVRYRQTALGVAWCVVQPLTSMAIFATLFGLMGRRPAAADVPYALVALCGLVAWQLFAGIVTQASASLVANQSMIGKVYFPRLLLPMAAVIPNLFDVSVSIAIIIAGCVAWGVHPSWHLIGLPVATACIVLVALAVGIGLAALNALYRDATLLVPFFLHVGFFVSPVVYEARTLIPPRWQILYLLNPLAPIIEFFRWCVLPGRPFPAVPLGVATVVVAAALVASLAFFRTVERSVADSI